MVKKAQDVVLTPGRGPIALNNVINTIGGKVTAKEVKSKNENLKIRTGKVVRFYPQTDKVSVELDDTGKVVRCVMLHNLAVSGEATISFTPSGSISTDVENDNEYSIIPFNEHIAAVLNIKDSLNKSEYLCLGFISKDSSLIKSNASVGEYLVSNDNSKISVKQSEVNISSENLYLNGNRIQSTDDLVKILNSSLYEFYFKTFGKKLGQNLYEYYPSNLMKLKIPSIDFYGEDDVEKCLYRFFELTEEEIKIVKKDSCFGK